MPTDEIRLTQLSRMLAEPFADLGEASAAITRQPLASRAGARGRGGGERRRVERGVGAGLHRGAARRTWGTRSRWRRRAKQSAPPPRRRWRGGLDAPVSCPQGEAMPEAPVTAAVVEWAIEESGHISTRASPSRLQRGGHPRFKAWMPMGTGKPNKGAANRDSPRHAEAAARAMFFLPEAPLSEKSLPDGLRRPAAGVGRKTHPALSFDERLLGAACSTHLQELSGRHLPSEGPTDAGGILPGNPEGRGRGCSSYGCVLGPAWTWD